MAHQILNKEVIIVATVVGYEETVYKRFVCINCAAIVQYVPKEVFVAGFADERTLVLGLNCPDCGKFHRTN